MTDTTTTEPCRGRRPARSRRPLPLRRHRRPDRLQRYAAAVAVRALEHDDVDDEPNGDDEPSLRWSGGLQYRLDAATDDLESDGNCDAEPDHEGPDGDEGDYSQHQLEPVDHDIRMMLRDSIDLKTAAKRKGR